MDKAQEQRGSISLRKEDMTLFADTPNAMHEEEVDKLFAAGVSFLNNKAYSSAYSCFDRLPAKDFRLLYNKALCCFMVGCLDECHRMLCEAGRLVPMNAGHGSERLPEAFLRYLHDEESPFCPMPQGTPAHLAYTRILRLKAEAAFKLHLYSEVKAISNRLGRKYKHIETLINTQKDNDNQ